MPLWLLIFCFGAAGCLGPAAPSAPAPGDCPLPPVASARALLKDLGLPHLELEAAPSAVRRQTARFATEVCFERAVHAAVVALVTDDRVPDGPLAFIRRRDHPVCARAESPEIAHCYLRREGARLSLASGTAASWRFAVTLPALSARPFWVSVRRAPDGRGRVIARSRGLFRSRVRPGRMRCSGKGEGDQTRCSGFCPRR